MLKSWETECIMKKIIREITKQCASKGVNVTEACVAFMVKLMMLSPDSTFKPNVPLGRQDIQRLVDLCVGMLIKEGSPSLVTLKMQVFFQTNLISREEIVQENRESFKKRIAPITKEIMEADANTKEELEKLYKRLVISAILRARLGNPTVGPVMREATAAMQSVFPIAELGQFISLSHKDKEQQIQELTEITAGIRLYNRDAKKGGEGIEDVPAMLSNAIEATRQSLHTILGKTLMKAYLLTAILDKYCLQDVETMPSGENLNYMKEYLVLSRQHEVFVRKLLSAVELCNEEYSRIHEHFQTRLKQINETVLYRTAIPTIQVYPQFIDLSQSWFRMQDEIVLLSNINHLAWNLQTHMQQADDMDKTLIEELLEDTEVLSDARRLEETTGIIIDQLDIEDGEVIDPANIKDFEHLSLQYLGFCAWALARGEGVLLPANPNMGVVQWKDTYYVFSSPEAAKEFCRDIDCNNMKAIDAIRKTPAMISFLEMENELSKITQQGLVWSKKQDVIIKQDCEVQTELHPIPSYIEKDYTWNEWELRRRALHLADICSRRTHSMQTLKSHFRQEVHTQVYLPKLQRTQTKADGYSNVPKPANYIFGLRGRKDNKHHVINLTRPFDE